MKRKKSKLTKVTLRFRLLDTGKETLYLDYYPAIIDPKTGKSSRREYLGRLVTPLKDKNGILREEKRKSVKEKYPKIKYEHSEADMDTINIAEQIRLKRKNELEKAEIYTESERELLKIRQQTENDFIQYFQQQSDIKHGSNHATWLSVLSHLKNYLKQNKMDTIRFCDITPQWCEGFKNWLLTVKTRDNRILATNTAATYFIKFKTALKTAYDNGYLQKDINRTIKGVKEVETRRGFLTVEELNTLINTPCGIEMLKRAALFSALTGLRHSDIIKMKWGEIRETDKGFTLEYTIQKTLAPRNLPVSEQAVMLCGERKAAGEPVFEGLKYSAAANDVLYQWLDDAGIKRKITFHCFRHTFATLQLAGGTQITTIQKMLGHKNIDTTLVYAKTLEESLREASEKIKLNF